MNVAIQFAHALSLERVAALAQRRRRGEIGDACYAAQYFLHWQIALHGRRYASRRDKHDPRPNHEAWLADLERATGNEASSLLCHYFERYGFLGVIPNVCAALQAWLQDRWPLTLCEHIPSPEELLRMQVQGTRVVTVLAESPRLLQPVLNKPNAFAFMVHDLEHAYKFFHDPDLYHSQRRFFARVLTVLVQGWFDLYRQDPIFAEKFAYLISDMNTHALHSLQFLRAILIEHHLCAAGKQPWQPLSHDARIAVDDIMALFAGCLDAAETEPVLRYAGDLA